MSKVLPFFVGRHVGRQALFHVVHDFGYHLFASQFPLIEQDVLVIVLFKKIIHVYFCKPCLRMKLFHLLAAKYLLTKSRSPVSSWSRPLPLVAAMLDWKGEKKNKRQILNVSIIYLFTDAHVFLHARHCGGPKQFATTFYFVCTYGEWREQARF